MLEEFEKRDVGIDIMTDASAALGMVEREGVGKVRHIDVGILWLQQKWLHIIVMFSKVLGTLNTADMMTKSLNREKSDQLMQDLNGEYKTGRAGNAVKLQGGPTDAV